MAEEKPVLHLVAEEVMQGSVPQSHGHSGKPPSSTALSDQKAKTNKSGAPPSPQVDGDSLSGKTHEVTNQASPLCDHNAFLCDTALVEGVRMHSGEWGRQQLEELGAAVGSSLWQSRAADANRYPPRLETHDRFGNRRDAAEFHPAYHQLMQLGIESGVSAFAWQPGNQGHPGAMVVRSCLMHLMYQLDPGVCCPLTMTFAAVPALERQRPEHDTEGYVAQWLAKLKSCKYSGADSPNSMKPGATIGMSMTEKQGGSDVRANSTQASPIVPDKSGPGDAFLLVGHKWFTSAPMSDAFLTLAQTKEGVSCFLVPRWLPDGSRNDGFTVQRLKEKLGDKSNASSEVEYRGAWGCMLGEAGRGVRTIVEMVVHTRLDCIIGSAALMRLSTQQAVQHTSSRSAFGRVLAQQPLMRGVLADLALESEAAMAIWLRLARAFDRLATDKTEAAFARLATAVSKYYICKRAPQVAYEAMECHGGNGYVEEGPMPKLFRQSPLNAIWEGSGNVICLDVVRAVSREPDSVVALLGELEGAVELAKEAVAASGQSNGYSQMVRELREQLALPLKQLELRARSIVDKLAVCLQAATLLQYGDAVVAQSFLATRIPASKATGEAHLLSHNFGSMGSSLPDHAVQRLIERALAPGTTNLDRSRM